MAEDKPANPDSTPQPSNAPAPAGGASPDEIRKALKAFKKRIKLARLDDESRLGHGAMSHGGPSGIQAIQPPREFPQAIWDELAKQGRIVYVGHGLYELGKAPE